MSHFDLEKPDEQVEKIRTDLIGGLGQRFKHTVQLRKKSSQRTPTGLYRIVVQKRITGQHLLVGHSMLGRHLDR